MSEHTRSSIPTDVPAEVSDPVRCPYCDRPFATPQLRTLHVGETHPEAMSEEEKSQYKAAVDEESDELFVLHMKVIAALTLTFFAIAYLYVFVLS